LRAAALAAVPRGLHRHRCVLGRRRAAIATLPRITLAESALHAPFASFGGTDAYPTPVEQAAVLLQHLAKNQPLPDANKRAAFLLTAEFLDANGLQWGPPDIEADAGLVERVAAGEATHDDVVEWIRGRTRRKGDEGPPSP
jgi:death-on-curing protein